MFSLDVCNADCHEECLKGRLLTKVAEPVAIFNQNK